MPLYGLSCIAACFGTGAYLEPAIVQRRVAEPRVSRYGASQAIQEILDQLPLDAGNLAFGGAENEQRPPE
jgi:hypothetical protein